MKIVPVADYGRSLCRPGAALLTIGADGSLTLAHTGEDPLVVRAKIVKLTQELMAQPGKFTELPLEHTFINGMYMRRLFVPKGSLIVGKIHKDACVNVVEQGDMSVLTESGFMRVKAGFTIASPGGIQKVGYAHEDTIFTNIFRTDETDIDKIEDVLTWASYEAMDSLTLAPLEIEGVEQCL